MNSTTLNRVSSRNTGQSRRRWGPPPKKKPTATIASPPSRLRSPAKRIGGEKSSPTFTTANADPQKSTSNENASTTKRRLPKIRKTYECDARETKAPLAYYERLAMIAFPRNAARRKELPHGKQEANRDSLPGRREPHSLFGGGS